MGNFNRYLRNLSLSGFTLLELAIVILIISLIAGGSVMIGQSTLQSVQIATTNNRLNVIETALMGFRSVGKRLPCPADGTLTAASASFGYEAANLGTCTGGSPPANFTTGTGGSLVVEGVVPVRTLNLPDEFLYDGWGRKITYSVWAPATGMNAFINYGASYNCGLITVKDAVGSIRSSAADYVLVSFGPDGHGAYTAQGTKYNSGSDNANELTNCHCNGSATDTGYAASYVMQDPTQSATDSANIFGDIVRFKERIQLDDYTDINNPAGNLVCPYSPPGFRIDDANIEFSGAAVAVGDVNGDGIPDLIIGAPGYSSDIGAVYVVFGTKSGFPNPLPLSSLNGSNGFMIYDPAANADFTGTAVAVGDVNGDGMADIIIGSEGTIYNGKTFAGTAFVVFGQKTWPATVSLGTLNGANGFRLDGTVHSEQIGQTLASGDVNGDGYADILIGSSNANNSKGVAYVIFGAAAFARGEYTLDNNAVTGIIDNAATKGFQINPNGTWAFGDAVAVGDVNGDGIADILIESPWYNGYRGSISVIMGKGRGKWQNPINVANLDGNNGWNIQGPTADEAFGIPLAVGDVNGDGIGDIIIGSTGGSLLVPQKT